MQMDRRSKHDLNFNFLPTAPEWEEECQFVNWRIGERTFSEWVYLSLLTCLSLGESENFLSGLICPPSLLTCLSLGDSENQRIGELERVICPPSSPLQCTGLSISWRIGKSENQRIFWSGLICLPPSLLTCPSLGELENQRIFLEWVNLSTLPTDLSISWAASPHQSGRRVGGSLFREEARRENEESDKY